MDKRVRMYLDNTVCSPEWRIWWLHLDSQACQDIEEDDRGEGISDDQGDNNNVNGSDVWRFTWQRAEHVKYSSGKEVCAKELTSEQELYWSCQMNGELANQFWAKDEEKWIWDEKHFLLPENFAFRLVSARSTEASGLDERTLWANEFLSLKYSFYAVLEIFPQHTFSQFPWFTWSVSSLPTASLKIWF